MCRRFRRSRRRRREHLFRSGFGILVSSSTVFDSLDGKFRSAPPGTREKRFEKISIRHSNRFGISRETDSSSSVRRRDKESSVINIVQLVEIKTKEPSEGKERVKQTEAKRVETERKSATAAATATVTLFACECLFLSIRLID